MSINLVDVEDIKQITFNGVASKGGVLQTTMIQSVNNFHFQPEFAILRNIAFNTTTATTGVYLIWSNLINDYMTSVTGQLGSGANHSPQTVMKIQRPIDQLIFQLYQLNNDGTITAPTSLPNDWLFSLTFDFVRLKKYNSFTSITK